MVEDGIGSRGRGGVRGYPSDGSYATLSGGGAWVIIERGAKSGEYTLVARFDFAYFIRGTGYGMRLEGRSEGDHLYLYLLRDGMGFGRAG